MNLALAFLVLLFSEFTVILTYVSGFGVERGVGPNVLVEIDGNIEDRNCFTDYNSQCNVSLPNSTHADVYAEYKSPNPFIVFKCEGGKDIDEAQEFLVVRCRRKFHLPWTGK